MCGLSHGVFWFSERGEGVLNIEINQDYALLFNAVTSAIRKLEPLSAYGPPEIQECIQLLKEAQQATEELNIKDED